MISGQADVSTFQSGLFQNQTSRIMAALRVPDPHLDIIPS